MELQGKVIAALPERSGVSSRGEWKTQEFVIETVDSQYPRKLVFTVFGADRLQRFNVQVGQIVNVAFDIDAREYNGRWYNSIRAYDVRQVDPNAAPAPAAAPVASPVASPVQAAGTTSAPAQTAAPVAAAADDGDDLPF